MSQESSDSFFTWLEKERQRRAYEYAASGGTHPMIIHHGMAKWIHDFVGIHRTTATELRPDRRFRPRTAEEQKSIEDHARAEIHKVKMMVAYDPSAALAAIDAAFAAGKWVGRTQATPTIDYSPNPPPPDPAH